MTVPTNPDDRRNAAFQQLIDAASTLLNLWTEPLDQGYPSYLPSWDEFQNDLIAWREATQKPPPWTVAAIRALLPEGFHPVETGGGCKAWRLDTIDGGYVLVSTESNRLEGDPEADEWIVYRYDDEGSSFLGFGGARPLKPCLALAAILPPPRRGQELDLDFGKE
jgi:hypothetical protein